MAFKIVYKKKIHKLPLHVNSVATMRQCILKLYPLIDPNFHIIYFHNGEPLEIISEDALYIILKILQLVTMKLLIHEGDVHQIAATDVNFMEQSQIFKQSMIQSQFEQINLGQSLQVQPIEQYQYKYDYEIINNQPIISYASQEFIWKITLRNICSKTWPQNLKLKCTDGIYKGQLWQVPEAIPGGVSILEIKLKAPDQVTSQLINWSLIYIENGQEIYLSTPIQLYLDIIIEQAENRYQGTLILNKAQQIKQILPDQSINYLCKFIEKSKLLQYPIQDIINALYDQKK